MGFFSLWERRAKLNFEVEKLTERIEFEKRRFNSEMEAQRKTMELKQMEKETLLKLKNEQDMAQVKLDAERAKIKMEGDYDKKMRAMETEYASNLSKLKSDTASEYYTKMGEALKDMTLNGTEQSRVFNDLAMKMFDKALEKPVPVSPTHMITEKRKTIKRESAKTVDV